MITDYALLKALHILLITTWLGTDLAVFSSTYWVQNPRYSPELRVQMGRLAGLLDMGPRSSLILMLATGAVLTLRSGAGLGVLGGAAQLVIGVLVVLCLAWLWAIWQQYFAVRDRAAGRDIGPRAVFLHGFRQLDLGLRVALALFMLAMGVLAVLGGNPLIPATWLDVKLSIYGLIVLAGVLIRVVADDFPIALGEIARLGSTPEREDRLNRALGNSRPIVVVLWSAIVLIVVVSVAKPFQ